MTRYHVVEIQVLAIKNLAAVLARISVPLEDVMPGELNFLLGQTIEQDQKDDARNTNFKRDRVNAFGMRLLFRKILPLAEIVRFK